MKVIDLFSGCGGMSLGFELADYEILFALEIDKWASETARYLVRICTMPGLTTSAKTDVLVGWKKNN